MFINTELQTRTNYVFVKKEEYDLLREKSFLFNQVCAIHRDKVRGYFKYDSDYKEAMAYLLDEFVKEDMKEADNE